MVSQKLLSAKDAFEERFEGMSDDETPYMTARVKEEVKAFDDENVTCMFGQLSRSDLEWIRAYCLVKYLTFRLSAKTRGFISVIITED